MTTFSGQGSTQGEADVPGGGPGGAATPDAESLFAVLAETLDAAIFIFQNGRVVYANPSAARLTGYSRDELLELDPFELAHPDERAAARARVEARRRGEPVPPRYETKFVTKGGEARWAEASVTVTRYRGAPATLITYTDVTAHKQADAARRESEDRYRLLFESIPLPAWVYDRETLGVLAVNDAAVRRYGYTREEFLRLKVTDLRPAEDVPIFLAAYKAFADRPTALHLPFRHRKKDGTVMDVEVSFHTINFEGRAARFVIAQDVTARNRAEAARQESEERYRLLSDAIPQVVFTADADGRCEYANRQWEEYSGLKFEETRGYGWMSAVHADDLTRMVAAWQECLREGREFSVEHRFRRADGTYRWFLNRSLPMKDERGRVVRWFGTATDVEDAKRAEAELRASEERFRAFMDHSPTVALLKDEAGRYVYGNRQWWRQFPASKAVRLGMTDADLWGAETAAIFEQSDRAVLGGDQPVQTLETGVSADGQPRHWMVFKFPMLDASGQRLLGGVVVDISDRVQAEELSAGQSRVLEMIATGAPLADTLEALTRFIERQAGDGYCSILLADDAGEQLRSGPAPSLPESYCRAIDPVPIGPEVGSCGTAAFRREPVVVTDIASDPLWAGGREEALKHGLRACSSLPIIGKDGRVLGSFAVYYRTSRAPSARDWKLIEVSAHLASIAIERKREEEEVRRLNQGLEQRVTERTAQLESAVNELEAFSYSVSHDLRAPLRAMDGFSRILLEDYAARLDADAERLLNVIRENARRMGQLIDDLLAFSRAGRKEPERAFVDMQAVAYQSLDELLAVSGGVSYSITVGDLPPARGDARLIRQALTNLISNAMKFSRQAPQPVIEISARRGAGEHVYCVRDNGVGFDMRYGAKLFGVFQRLHRAEEFEGTGVGLAIAQRIIQRHGGRVWAEGKVNEGAAFYFTLPGGGER
jgi:PAS domain S-box-containing protein